jgi:hypothetical protein
MVIVALNGSIVKEIGSKGWLLPFCAVDGAAETVA